MKLLHLVGWFIWIEQLTVYGLADLCNYRGLYNTYFIQNRHFKRTYINEFGAQENVTAVSQWYIPAGQTGEVTVSIEIITHTAVMENFKVISADAIWYTGITYWKHVYVNQNLHVFVSWYRNHKCNMSISIRTLNLMRKINYVWDLCTYSAAVDMIVWNLFVKFLGQMFTWS